MRSDSGAEAELRMGILMVYGEALDDFSFFHLMRNWTEPIFPNVSSMGNYQQRISH